MRHDSRSTELLMQTVESLASISLAKVVRFKGRELIVRRVRPHQLAGLGADNATSSCTEWDG